MKPHATLFASAFLGILGYAALGMSFSAAVDADSKALIGAFPSPVSEAQADTAPLEHARVPGDEAEHAPPDAGVGLLPNNFIAPYVNLHTLETGRS